MTQFFYCFLFFSLFILQNSYHINTESKLHYTILPISVKKNNCHIYDDIFSASYNGNCYQSSISSKLGGQIVLKNEEFTSSYYLMISEKITLQIDCNGCVKGYVVEQNAVKDSKLYLIDINLFNDKTNTTLYDWNITELPLQSGQMIPEKTILVYADPTEITIKNFPQNTRKSYPYMNKNQVTTLVLPTIELHTNYNEIIKSNNNIVIKNAFEHTIIRQVH